MKTLRTLRRTAVAALLLVAFLIQGTWALAGTTGSIRGTVMDGSGAPVAGAKVTASSPSQTISTTTDARGDFGFLSLAPDSYTVSVDKDGYNPISLAGVTVFADNSQTLALTATKTLTEIVKTTSRAAGNLVKPGTTSDIYSVNAATQATVAGVGGGYNLNSAYSAIYSQPGVSSYIGNYGQGQVFYIRGASYGETGYEFDGVPVNRAFDNYGGSSLSNLGQQELQVYTGGSPSSGTSATLGGYINQVIKTGTYPGFGTVNFGLGSPGFYHDLQIESGGASPNRLFSWYAGFGGYNQAYRPCNNQSCANYTADGTNPQGFFGNEVGVDRGFSTGDWFGNGPFASCPGNNIANAPATYFTSTFYGAPTCTVFATQAGGYQVGTSDRELVANFHFGIPHKNDGGKDDVQLLYNHGSVYSSYNDSINDVGGLGMFTNALAITGSGYGFGNGTSLNTTACTLTQYAGYLGYGSGICAPAGSTSPFPYADGRIFPSGTAFGQAATGLASTTYWFPNSPTNRVPYAGLPLGSRAGIFNDVAIVKAQYQKNIGSNAYARIYAYSFYSDWLQNSPNEASLYYGLIGDGSSANGDYPSPDYELETHTRGVSFEYANQINAQNLIRFTGNYVTASLNRFNNTSWEGTGPGFSSPIFGTVVGGTATSLVDANGNCYSFSSGALLSCMSSSTQGTFGAPTKGHADGHACSFLGAATAACLANAQFVVTRPSGTGTTNGIVPKFTTFALEDEFRPNDKLDLNIGVRLERYQYDIVNSSDPANAFWWSAAAKVYCYDPATLLPVFQLPTKANPGAQGTPYQTPITGQTGGKCFSDAAGTTPYLAPSGQQALHPNGVGGNILLTNVSPSSLAHTIFSPRLGGTYTLDPNTVLRFSAGKYTQPTPAAFEQYLNQYARSAVTGDFAHFFGFGFYNPSHDNPVQTSNNFDFSLEKRLKGTDITFKLSPFYRDTTHQSVSVPLGPNFVSAVNLGHQVSKGVEFQIQKGDPSRDGISGSVSYTYTDAKIRYDNAPNGKNAIDTINNYVTAFNALTQAGGGSPYYCGSSTAPLSNGANPGVPSVAACTAIGGSAILNPYYAMSSQALLDRNGWYPTYPNSPPEDAPAGEIAALSPHVFTGWLQWKHDRLAIAPNFIVASGPKYGGPTDLYGVDPRVCDLNQGDSGIVADTPTAADYFFCGGTPYTASNYLAVPNSFSGNTFDSVGKYTEPWQLNIGAHVTYDFSSKMKGVLDVSNIFNRCFGGTKTPWQAAYPAGQHICGWSSNAYSWTGNVPGEGFFYGSTPGNAANGTGPVPKSLSYPYTPFVGDLPVQAYFQLQIKL